MEKTIFEVRQIDAWIYDNEWNYNKTFKLFNFKTSAKNEKRAFLNALKNHGIKFYRGKIQVTSDGSVYELINRKTKEPLFCAIPQY